jgi:thioredoxin-like negative regulator of GroEL
MGKSEYGFMRRLTPTLLLLTAWVCPAADAPKEIPWQHRFDQAPALAKETGKPLLIDFWATWCPPCRRMEAELWPSERLGSMADRYIFVKVDVDRDKSTESHYLVHAIPTIVVADPWGHAVGSHQGFASVPMVLGMLRQLPSDYSEVKQWFDILESDRKNTDALYRVGRYYGDRHAFHLSNEFYPNALKTSGAKENAGLREEVTLSMAINQFRDGNMGDARKRLEVFRKTFPDAARQPEAMLAQVAVALKQHKRSEAEKTFQELQRRFPDSQAATNASAMLAQAKQSTP